MSLHFERDNMRHTTKRLCTSGREAPPFFFPTLNTAHSLIVPIARYQGWIGRAWRSNVVHVLERRSKTGPQLLPIAGVIDFAREGGVPAELFARFCDTNLCSESWEFVVIAVHYEMVRTAAEVGIGNSCIVRRSSKRNCLV